MYTSEEMCDESSEASVGEMIQRRAAKGTGSRDTMEHDGAKGPGSRDVGVQMRTHYVLEPYRYFSKVRDVGTQTRENANKVIFNPRVVSNSYSEAVQLKRQDREFSFVYDLKEHDLYRIRKSRQGAHILSETSDSGSLTSRSSYDSSETGDSDVEEFYEGTRTVGVQMDTKYLVQESRPKSVVRDVGIQTKLPPLYAPSESEMIEKLWQNQPLSKNVTCSLPSSWRHRSQLSVSDMSYMSGSGTQKYGYVPERSLEVNEKLRGSDSRALDRNTSIIMHKNKHENIRYPEDLIKQRSFRARKSNSGRRQNERLKSGSVSEVSTLSKSFDGQSQMDGKNRRGEDTFELTTFEYLGIEHLPVQLKSENVAIATQTESGCNSNLKVFRKPFTRPKSEKTCNRTPSSDSKRKISLSNSDTSLEIVYTAPRLTKERGDVHTREHIPPPVEIVHGGQHPYRPKEDAKYSETRPRAENSSSKTCFETDDSFKPTEIGPEPDVVPAELVEKPAVKPRHRKVKPPPPPDVLIRVGGGWMKEEHHLIQHRPLHRKFQSTSDRIPFVRSQFHHNPSKTPVVNKQRKQTDKIRYASFIP